MPPALIEDKTLSGTGSLSHHPLHFIVRFSSLGFIWS